MKTSHAIHVHISAYNTINPNLDSIPWFPDDAPLPTIITKLHHPLIPFAFHAIFIDS